ncbi:M60 family peptidase N-terminal accessory domain-containing protein [Saccharicrinis sp. 156]|uniref:M60 family peptidase N-terminal accessory domain-containing protein n=1 Tax=Saccharicrinis sp. 156 TaxID=3417574 RepID=UPI003D3323A2
MRLIFILGLILSLNTIGQNQLFSANNATNKSLLVHNNANVLLTDTKTHSLKTGSSEFIASINSLKDHVAGTATLTANELNIEKLTLEQYMEVLENDVYSIKAAFELVAAFEAKYGGLFTKGTTTEGGFLRSASGFELENVMLDLQQGLIDYAYTEDNLVNNTSLFENVKFETSSFFPGSVDAPSNPNISYTVQVNGTHMPVWGSQPNYVTEDARRPTGCYLAPGSIATVTVPSSLLGTGASLIVGAHSWDLSKKSQIKRMNRISKRYEIHSTTITIANPLGGGIYINIPYEKDLGLLEITLENVVRSPFYSRTAANQTSLSDWLNTERSHPAPWADFETEKFMMQVPTAWIYNMDDPVTLMNEWDQSMDAVSKLHGRPFIRAKTGLYVQVDVILRGSANYPGYPQSNHAYNPYNTHTAGYYSGHPLIQGPRYNKSNLYVVFHELGHAEKIPKFSGELESYINFLWVAVQNNKFDVSLDQAFQESFAPNFKMTIDQAAISWMITENFRNDNPMRDISGGKEGAYQHRGYGKYAEIVRLFGWEALEDFYSSVSQDAENGITYSINFDPTDSRILRMSKAAGADLRPLIHFWGVHPLSFNGLETSINADTSIHKSSKIFDQLQYYKTIIPKTNTDFQNFGLKHFSESKINNYSGSNIWSYQEGFYKYWWDLYDEVEANAAIKEIDHIINIYFPEGKPGDSSQITPYPKTDDVSVYPTLFKDHLIVEVKKPGNIYIYNQLGVLMIKEKVKGNTTISTQNLNSGIYIMHLDFPSVNTTIKLVKQ